MLRPSSPCVSPSSDVKICKLTAYFRAVQILEDEPFESLRPTLECLLANTEKNKQRAAAEFVAGIIAG